LALEMARPARRARRAYSRTKRSKAKTLVCAQTNTTGTTQANEKLFGATYPCTVAGMRWEVTIQNLTGSLQNVMWAVYILREGNTHPPLSTTLIMAPEQNCIAWGVTILGTANNGESNVMWTDKTKSMRKLQGGDQVFWSVKSTGGDVAFVAAFQFFTLV